MRESTGLDEPRALRRRHDHIPGLRCPLRPMVSWDKIDSFHYFARGTLGTGAVEVIADRLAGVAARTRNPGLHRLRLQKALERTVESISTRSIIHPAASTGSSCRRSHRPHYTNCRKPAKPRNTDAVRGSLNPSPRHRFTRNWTVIGLSPVGRRPGQEGDRSFGD
jgi:hypothetical protein